VIRKIFEYLDDPDLFERGATIFLNLSRQVYWLDAGTEKFLLCGKLSFSEDYGREILSNYATGAFNWQRTVA
jgi:hypothetical protein